MATTGAIDPVRIALVLGLGGLLASGCASAAADAAGADLTGTWEGLQVCDDNNAGDQINFVTDDRVEISQSGRNLRLRRVTRDGAQALTYEGRIGAIAGSARVEALVSVCDGTYPAQEMLRLRRALANQDGSGSFDAESLYQSTAAPGLEGREIFGSCKWAYTRVSTQDPGVPACRQ